MLVLHRQEGRETRPLAASPRLPGGRPFEREAAAALGRPPSQVVALGSTIRGVAPSSAQGSQVPLFVRRRQSITRDDARVGLLPRALQTGQGSAHQDSHRQRQERYEICLHFYHKNQYSYISWNAFQVGKVEEACCFLAVGLDGDDEFRMYTA